MGIGNRVSNTWGFRINQCRINQMWLYICFLYDTVHSSVHVCDFLCTILDSLYNEVILFHSRECLQSPLALEGGWQWRSAAVVPGADKTTDWQHEAVPLLPLFSHLSLPWQLSQVRHGCFKKLFHCTVCANPAVCCAQWQTVIMPQFLQTHSQLLYSITMHGRLVNMPKWTVGHNFVEPIAVC